ncbi:MAG TPA: glycoside hydrolase family 32 protein, partial [Chitinophagaceae bacterium]|nr:glycoside hydrolase family 32 protein [Chitinophagaceae bacterium]
MRMVCILLSIFFYSCSHVKKVPVHPFSYNDPHRPQVHFSPSTGWMNDPNGLVFFDNTYHLFYQYYPDSTVWGPMHWGHATTTDLLHWQHQPIALYPDSLGYIFSGSAVVDSANTSGFGKDGIVPLVAIFTHHDPNGEKRGTSTYQNQSLAYSLDKGQTWTKYAGNPVLKNPGIRDFRDPKVRWHAETKKWILTLATLDRITFYSSPNLKDWTRESEFGETVGAHGGVWECPDLLPLTYKGETVWVLIVNINPGGPNGGSATQYFTGRFDGKTFTPLATDTRWLDYGPDEYAGITWSNTGTRTLFIGWMSNWQYAEKVPTAKWRSATTIPRDISLEKVGDKYLVRSLPVPELAANSGKTITLQHIDALHSDLGTRIGKLTGPAQLKLTTDTIKNFTI